MTDSQILLSAVAYVGGAMGAFTFMHERAKDRPLGVRVAFVALWPLLLIGLAVYAMLDKLDT
jgi:hypothetical protein